MIAVIIILIIAVIILSVCLYNKSKQPPAHIEQPPQTNNWQLELKVLEAQINESRNEKERLKAELQRLDETIKGKLIENDQLELKQNTLLQALKDTRRAVSDIEHNEYGYRFAELTGQEMELVKLLEDIALRYSFIAEDIRSISWKRVFLPRAQKLAKECNVENVSGIYKITMKRQGSGGTEYNYVGKAVNIKDRWYQHLGKMCGKDSVGNERLYQYISINELVDPHTEIYFNVLERVQDTSILDQEEKKWIKTIGDLNVKNV